MRFFFPGLIVFFSFQLLAQDGKDPYYIQQAPAQQIALDCYQRSLDEGLATEKRRRYQPSRDFLLYNNPECFEITYREAQRAFKNRYWDDAAALFRVAKNCADADQADRMTADKLITACRQASQNELLKKEQDAVRQARHALAANRANDARPLQALAISMERQ